MLTQLITAMLSDRTKNNLHAYGLTLLAEAKTLDSAKTLTQNADYTIISFDDYQTSEIINDAEDDTVEALFHAVKNICLSNLSINAMGEIHAFTPIYGSMINGRVVANIATKTTSYPKQQFLGVIQSLNECDQDALLPNKLSHDELSTISHELLQQSAAIQCGEGALIKIMSNHNVKHESLIIPTTAAVVDQKVQNMIDEVVFSLNYMDYRIIIKPDNQELTSQELSCLIVDSLNKKLGFNIALGNCTEHYDNKGTFYLNVNPASIPCVFQLVKQSQSAFKNALVNSMMKTGAFENKDQALLAIFEDDLTDYSDSYIADIMFMTLLSYVDGVEYVMFEGDEEVDL